MQRPSHVSTVLSLFDHLSCVDLEEKEVSLEWDPTYHAVSMMNIAHQSLNATPGYEKVVLSQHYDLQFHKIAFSDEGDLSIHSYI